MWSSTYSSRRSHEQTHSESKQSRSSSPGESLDSHKRTSSDATPRPTPANPRFLASTDQDASKNVFTSSTTADVFTSSSKRLGFLADKLSSSLSGAGSTQKNQTQLHVPHSHSRGDSNSTSISLSPSPAPMASSSSISNSAKAHASPSKASYGRTYDSKLVTREMHRLGNFPQFPATLAPQLSTAPSTSSLSLPTPGSISQASLASATTADPWRALHVHVLPLFNGEPLRIPIEDLNLLVKRHISTVVSSSPSRAIVKLENDASELIASGMVTLNAKLMGVDDEKLVARVVETWGFFWDQILTYVEGVLLPLQTDPLLSSLSKTPKTHHRATSPSRPGVGQSSKSSSQLSMGSPSIDVRTVALRSFRDRVVYPLYLRLHSRLSLPNRQDVFPETGGYQQPRLQQMLLVLSAQSRQRPVTLSLTAPAPQPTPSETAITDLLQLVRNPHPQASSNRKQPFKNGPHSRTPSFLSGGLPRDRRGRIAHKNGSMDPAIALGGIDEDDYGEETPRLGLSVSGSYAVDVEREKERELLESLRSPEPGARARIGGWGLGGVHEDSIKTMEEEEEDDTLDMDEAQADLEKYMANMNAQPDPKRR